MKGDGEGEGEGDRQRRRPTRALRLLPWESGEGKPCYLSTDEPGSALWRLADEVEADQLRDSGHVLGGARAVLADWKAGEYALRHALRAVTHSLTQVRRVAESRGARLPELDDGQGRVSADDVAEGTSESRLWWVGGRVWTAVSWWYLRGQFSWPVLLVSPRRRRVIAEIEALYSRPGFAQEWSRRLAERIRQANEEALLDVILRDDTPRVAQQRAGY